VSFSVQVSSKSTTSSPMFPAVDRGSSNDILALAKPGL
jgi:hypothetical protein